MEELIKAMSNSDLLELKAKHEGNQSIQTLIDGILEAREYEEQQAKALEDFTKGIAKTFSKLPHPDNIYNVYARWAEVDVPQGEPEEVEVVDKDGNATIETRQPTVKEYQWVVEVNHAVKQSNANSGGTPKTSKRAITVYKRNGTQLELKGNFTSASKACEYFGLPIGADSAGRVLDREGYIREPYDGTDFTS